MSEKITIRIGKKRKSFDSIKDAAKAFKIPYQVFYQRMFVMEWPTAKVVGTKVRVNKAKRGKKRV